MKLISLCFFFSPQGSAGSLRNYAVVTHLRPFFEEVWVGTAAFPHVLDASAPVASSEIKVSGIPHLDYHCLLRGSLARVNRRYFWPGRLRRLLSACFPGLGFSEGGWWYILRGYQLACRQVRQEEECWVYSSFRPMADHWIAFLLKLRYKNVRWIADFRDYPVGVRGGLLRLLLRKADIVTTVSNGLATALRPFYPGVEVLTNAYCPLVGEKRMSVKQEHFTLVYTGSLYPQQEVFPLREALASLVAEGLLDPERVRVVYAGKDGRIWDDWWKDFPYREMMVQHGLLTLAAARQLQADAGINVLLSWCGEGQRGILTSKLYEYLYVGKPLLGLVRGDPDPELEAIFGPLGHAYLAYAHESHIRGLRYFILKAYQAWLCGREECYPDLSRTWSHNILTLVQQIKSKSHEAGTLAEQLVPQPL